MTGGRPGGPPTPRFIAALDGDTHVCLDGLVRLIGVRVGALPNRERRRRPSRRDVLRAALAVAEREPEVQDRIETELLRQTVLPIASAELEEIGAEFAGWRRRVVDRYFQDLAELAACELDRLAVSGDLTCGSRRHQVSTELGVLTLHFERIAASVGSFEALRAMRDLARRLRCLRGAIDPVTPGGRARCPHCGQQVRRATTVTGESLEIHCDQTGGICRIL